MPGAHFVGEDDGDYGPATPPAKPNLIVPAVDVPEGWDLLEAGPVRHVRVIKAEIGQPNGTPFLVIQTGRCNRLYAEVKILGESALVHQLSPPTGEKGLACLETSSAILGKRNPDYRK